MCLRERQPRKGKSMTARCFLILVLAGSTYTGCSSHREYAARIDGKAIRLDFDSHLHSRVAAVSGGNAIQIGNFSPSETVVVDGQTLSDFQFVTQTSQLADNAGRKEKSFTLTGRNGPIRKEVEVTLFDDFPAMAFFQVRYVNEGSSDLTVTQWTNNRYFIHADPGSAPPFWSYQSGSYENRPDWVLPLKTGFSQKNYMGMNGSDYGGGTPVADIWRKDIGIGVGSVETEPRLISLPVSMPAPDHAEVGIECSVHRMLKPGDTISTYRTFVSVHHGDYFRTLADYRRFMIHQGIQFQSPPQTPYEPIWCAWGFERNFTPSQVTGALPKVRELGFKWAVLDDGWQTAEGDWYLFKGKFPHGDRDMIRMVDAIHAQNLKAGLWWAPLSVDPGTDLIKQHPDWLLLNEDGSKRKISWWDAYYLCPAYPPVREYTRKLVEKFMKTWGYDGLKIDGQYLNAAPPCYNPAHNHTTPEESFEKTPEFFREIYETAMSINPQAVVEICPCGTAYSFLTMPYMNQPVASDPESSWQVRLKGKTLKALMGPSVAYFGDHVELSDGGDDFASTVGVGGVIGTKFTWPPGAGKRAKIDLTPEREKTWKEWVNIYDEKMLSQGTYRGDLYDIGFDRPEAHAIERDGRMYYAFYADAYEGNVQLRGLQDHVYRINDYEHNESLGTVKGPDASLAVSFRKHLLLEATPE
jgi:alpha-galactosidase